MPYNRVRRQSKRRNLIDIQSKTWLPKLRGDLFTGRANTVALVSEIKNIHHSGFILEKITPLLRVNPELKAIAFGVALPRAYGDLRTAPGLGSSGDLRRELSWSLWAIGEHTSELTEFITHSKCYEHQLLSGNISAALDTLNMIESNIGVSLWSLENQILIAELSGGLEANKDFLSKLLQGEISPFVAYLAEWYSRRAERSYSARQFEIDLDQEFEHAPEMARHVTNYLRFKLEVLPQLKGDELSRIVSIDHKSPIVDRYLTVLRVCQIVASDHQLSEYKVFGKACLARIAEMLNVRVLGLDLLRPENISTYEPSDSDLTAIACLDLYTQARYKCCAVLALCEIEKRPAELLNYQLYARSAVALGHTSEANNVPSISRELVDNLITLYRSDAGVAAAFEKLLKLATILGAMPLAVQLRGLLAEYRAPHSPQVLQNLAAISTSVVNPALFQAFEGETEPETCLKRLKELFPGSETIHFFLWVHSLKREAVPYSGEVPKYRENRYLGKFHLDSGEIGQARLVLQSIKHPDFTEIIPPFIDEDVSTLLYLCHLRSSDFAACLELFTSRFFRVGLFTTRMAIGELCESLEREITTWGLIETPIVIHIFQESQESYDYNKVYAALDNLLKAHDCKRPIQLVSKFDENLEKVVYFLQFVCMLRVLKNSPEYPTQSALEHERIEICQWIAEHSPDSREICFEEISMLTQRSTIRSALNQLDRGRVNVDAVGLFQALRESIARKFSRYIEFVSLSVSGIQISDATAALAQIAESIDLDRDVKSIKLDYEKNAQLHLFREMYLEVRDQFAYSNVSGLDSYLSLRIRHGALITHLRRHLENHHLITKRGRTDSGYLPNLHWLERLQLAQDEHSNIQGILSRFSSTIDATFSMVRDRWIQVRTERRGTDGLFDFSYDNTSLWNLYQTSFKHIDDSDEFLFTAIDQLYARTEECLCFVRESITNTLKNLIQDEIQRLQDDLQQHSARSRMNPLFSEIANCRTGLSYEIETISHWFQFEPTSLYFEANIALIGDVSIEIAKNLYPGRFELVESRADGSRTIKAAYYTSLVEIYKLLIANAIVHSPDGHTPSIKVYSCIDSDTLTLVVSNTMPGRGEAERASAKVSALCREIAHEGISESVSTEGGTGLSKLYKMLAHDLRLPNFSVNADSIGNWINVNIELPVQGLLA